MKNRSKQKDRMRLRLIQECITKSNNQFKPKGYILELVNIILNTSVDFFVDSLFTKNENKYKKELQNYTNLLIGLYSKELYDINFYIIRRAVSFQFRLYLKTAMHQLMLSTELYNEMQRIHDEIGILIYYGRLPNVKR